MKKQNFKKLMGSALAASFLLTSQAQAGKIQVNPYERDQLISSAKVWSDPGDISSKNMMVGGNAKHSFNENINCTFYDGFYTEVADTGKTNKFWCATDEKDPVKTKIKVRYNADNGEVFAEVIASRLFWALGFFTDDVYPVQVSCLNCPEEPWTFLNYLAYAKGQASQKRPPIDLHSSQGRRESIEKAIEYVQADQKKRNDLGAGHIKRYDPALTESKYKGESIELAGSSMGAGFGLDELGRIEASRGGSSKAEIDALKLAVAFVKHGDSKPKNQRLACPKDKISVDSAGKTICKEARVIMHDLGATFGTGAWEILGISAGIGQTSKLSYDAWKKAPVWKNVSTCQAEIGDALNGTLKNPTISEAGRKFLADLLSQITDRQLVDLFTAARVELRQKQTSASVSQWVELFNQKRAEIINAKCPQ